MQKLSKMKKYRVQFFPAGSKKPHEFVGEYLGKKHKPGTPDSSSIHWFSLRPAAGTITLEEHQVIAIHSGDELSIKVPRKL